MRRTYRFAPRKLGLKFRGHCISGISTNSQAEHAGVQVGWIISSINGKLVDNDKDSIKRLISKVKKTGEPITIVFFPQQHIFAEVAQQCKKGHRMLYYTNSDNNVCDICWNYIPVGSRTLICDRCKNGRCEPCSWNLLDFEKMAGNSFNANDYPQATFWFFQHRMHNMGGAPYINVSVANKRCGPEWHDFPQFLEQQHQQRNISKDTSFYKVTQLWNPTTPQQEKEKKMNEDREKAEEAKKKMDEEKKKMEEKEKLQNIIEDITHAVEFKAGTEESWGVAISLSNHWSRWKVITVDNDKQAQRLGVRNRDRVISIDDIPIDEDNYESMRKTLSTCAACKIIFKRMGISEPGQKKSDALAEFRLVNELTATEPNLHQLEQELNQIESEMKEAMTQTNYDVAAQKQEQFEEKKKKIKKAREIYVTSMNCPESKDQKKKIGNPTDLAQDTPDVNLGEKCKIEPSLVQHQVVKKEARNLYKRKKQEAVAEYRRMERLQARQMNNP